MRLLLVALSFLFVFSTVRNGMAQQNWVPKAIDSLEESASSKSGYTFDHSMLVLAAKLDPDNENLRRVIAGVNGISVRTYRFQRVSTYDPAALGSVDEEYRAAGWKRVINKGEKTEDSARTDLWVRTQDNAITNVALLLMKPTEVTFVAVSGSISPIDLLHLSGHFGIPQIEGGVSIPTSSRQ
jgi:hypothetical protein